MEKIPMTQEDRDYFKSGVRYIDSVRRELQERYLR